LSKNEDFFYNIGKNGSGAKYGSGAKTTG